ncbi:hypothetical protein RUM44_009489 [Polyplax serrata]|uniref:Globin domain-containing protein n=1 Tax=Polyplax serrata TaxID=468196 RepID=A0ABR1ASU9_POLSC
MAFPTTKGKDPDAKQESLSVAIKAVTKTWDSIKNDSDSYKILIQQEYFRKNPGRMDLFQVQKYEEKLTDEVIAKRLQKHSTVVINCMEALVEFINGNEETKPILFVLGKQHKMLNVNEKMFMEMKEAICKVIRRKLDFESSKAWDTILQYIFINYIFPGMYKVYYHP